LARIVVREVRKCENHGALPARTPRDCHGTEQWQNTSRVPAKNLPKKRLRPLWGSVTIIASGVGGMNTLNEGVGGMNTLYIHFFRRHEIDILLFFRLRRNRILYSIWGLHMNM